MDKKQDEFYLDIANYVYDVLSQTSVFVKRLGELEDKYPEEYKNLTELRHNPLQLFEKLDEIEDDKTKSLVITKLFKIFFKLASLSEQLTNIFFIESERKKSVSKELKNLADEINTYLSGIKEIK